MEENDLLGVQLRSFEYIVDVEMTKIGRELGTFSPRLLAPGLRDLQFKIERWWLGKADFMEKEGVSRLIYPIEARIRGLTYAGTVYMEFSVYENETFKSEYQVELVDCQ
ncbi:hypothetical protein [Candidatus Nanopusillus massiliensis]|uniref:hypothetical protein n=1 Tax=Candidatus Nanopusillus massiliensis TaxID=2897163 RepID=UPI0021135A22|nr:hypothetical protein [Candidatus Nanopusillus massiliensis]